MSKGSGRRPQQEDDKRVASEWDRLFGKGMPPVTPEHDGLDEAIEAISKMTKDRIAVMNDAN
jgi:hypothetical protein